MQAADLQQIHAKAWEDFPKDYKESIGLQGLVFALQTQVFHKRAAGMKLRIGYIQECSGRVWIWAIVTFGNGVIFYKDHQEFPVRALKYVNFEEPMRTLAGKLKDRQFRRLRSFVYFLFMERGVVGRWIEGHSVTFADFKLGCERIAAAKRNKFYRLEPAKRIREADDEGYNSDGRGLSKKSTRKRAHNAEDQGSLRVLRSS